MHKANDKKQRKVISLFYLFNIYYIQVVIDIFLLFLRFQLFVILLTLVWCLTTLLMKSNVDVEFKNLYRSVVIYWTTKIINITNSLEKFHTWSDERVFLSSSCSLAKSEACSLLEVRASSKELFNLTEIHRTRMRHLHMRQISIICITCPLVTKWTRSCHHTSTTLKG